MWHKSPYLYAVGFGKEALCTPDQIVAIARFELARSSYYKEQKADPMPVRLEVGVVEAFEKYLKQFEPHCLAYFYAWMVGVKHIEFQGNEVIESKVGFNTRLHAAWEGFLSKHLQLSEIAKLDKRGQKKTIQINKSLEKVRSKESFVEMFTKGGIGHVDENRRVRGGTNE